MHVRRFRRRGRRNFRRQRELRQTLRHKPKCVGTRRDGEPRSCLARGAIELLQPFAQAMDIDAHGSVIDRRLCLAKYRLGDVCLSCGFGGVAARRHIFEQVREAPPFPEHAADPHPRDFGQEGILVLWRLDRHPFAMMVSRPDEKHETPL